MLSFVMIPEHPLLVLWPASLTRTINQYIFTATKASIELAVWLVALGALKTGHLPLLQEYARHAGKKGAVLIYSLLKYSTAS